MPSVLTHRLSVKPNCAKRPLLPVQVTGYFVGGASRQDVIDNAAVLSITDQVTGEEKAYWTQAIFEGAAGERCLGFRLTAFVSGEVYDLPRDLSSCDCPDRTFKSERPGGCRHMAALRQALPTVAGTHPSVPSVVVPMLPTMRKPDRKTERDEATCLAAE